MTSYAFAVEWLKAYRRDPEEAVALYANDFLFDSPVLDLHLAGDKPALIRAFAVFANANKDNGVGIHNIRVRSFQGDGRSGLIRWAWSPRYASAFLGLDVTGKPLASEGRSFQIYGENGKIKNESAWSDATACPTNIGYGGVADNLLSKTTARAQRNRP